MSQTKYVIVEFGQFMVMQPFLFSERASHDEVARALAYDFHTGFDKSRIYGAGFCGKDRETGLWKVYGKSTSLKLESKPEDETIINRSFGLLDNY
jgi:hypothetical protein